jgi:hypothetical protein
MSELSSCTAVLLSDAGCHLMLEGLSGRLGVGSTYCMQA